MIFIKKLFLISILNKQKKSKIVTKNTKIIYYLTKK